MSDDWDSPATGEQFVIKNYVGALCIFAVNEFLPQFPTKYGNSDALKCELVILDGPNAGEHFDQAILFGRALMAQLKTKIGGKPVLGRLTQNPADAKMGQSAPYRVADPTDEDKAKASEWVKANGPIVSVPTTSTPQAASPSDGENWRSQQGQPVNAGNHSHSFNQGPPPNPNPWGNADQQGSYVNAGDQPPY